MNTAALGLYQLILRSFLEGTFEDLEGSKLTQALTDTVAGPASGPGILLLCPRVKEPGTKQLTMQLIVKS